MWSGVLMSEPSREGSVQGRNHSEHLGGGYVRIKSSSDLLVPSSDADDS